MTSSEILSPSRIRMLGEAEVYQDNNNITRLDAIDCFEEYATKMTWIAGERVFDIGCADGSVTKILAKYLPDNYAMLIGYDINERMVRYAAERHGDSRTQFSVLDIEADLPEEMKESFDHGFSLCTLHWIRNQEKGFTNVYNLLKAGGEFMATLFGRMPTYSLFMVLSRTKKWGPWLKGIDQMVSPYHDCHDPEAKMVKMLNKIGFRNIDVRCKQRIFVYDNTEDYKRIVSAINPFKVPKELFGDFLDDLMQVGRNMGVIDEVTDKVTLNYNLFVVNCRK